MRFMVIVKASEASERGEMPTGELVEKMGEFNNELIAAGMMLDGAGLKPSSAGFRVSFRDGETLVTDGPFAETKELVAGYWVIQARDLEDAKAWMRRAPMLEGDVLEIRPLFEPEDFEGIASEEIIQQEKDWRDAQAAGKTIAG